MKRSLHWLLCGLLASGAAAAQDMKAGAFQPITLAGDWKLQDAQRGARLGGDIRIELLRKEGDTIHGTVSYDGRQSLYKCGTRGFASDTPVPAEIWKDEAGYTVSFQLRCAVGVSQRKVLLQLACGSDGACTQTAPFPWGTQVITVREAK